MTQDKCSLCELGITNRPVTGYGNPNAQVMIVLPSPNYYVSKTNNILEGATGEMLVKLLKMVNIPLDDVYITHIIKCRTNTIKVKNITACKPYFKDELSNSKAKIIMTMGTLPYKVLTKRKDAIINYRNKAINTANGILIIPTFNLAYITRDVRLHGLALEAFANLYKLYYTYVNPNIKQFESSLHPSVKSILDI